MAVSAEVDQLHAELVEVVRKYGHTEEARGAILRGAADSLMIERVFRGHVAGIIAGDA